MGFGELLVLVIVAIVVVGPKDLPKVLRKLGQWSGKLRRMAGDLRSQSGIDDVLRHEGLGKDIAEIRKLARGELEGVSRDMQIHDNETSSTFANPADPYVHPSLGSRYVSEDREHPMVGPDGFDAMPDTSFVYAASFPRSALDRDPLYRTGSTDGIVPDDPPDEDLGESHDHDHDHGQDHGQDENAELRTPAEDSSAETGHTDGVTKSDPSDSDASNGNGDTSNADKSSVSGAESPAESSAESSVEASPSLGEPSPASLEPGREDAPHLAEKAAS